MSELSDLTSRLPILVGTDHQEFLADRAKRVIEKLAGAD